MAGERGGGKSEIRSPKSERNPKAQNPKPFGHFELFWEIHNFKLLSRQYGLNAKTQRRKSAKGRQLLRGYSKVLENTCRCFRFPSFLPHPGQRVMAAINMFSNFKGHLPTGSFFFAPLRLCAFAFKQKIALNHPSAPLPPIRNSIFGFLSDFGLRISDLPLTQPN